MIRARHTPAGRMVADYCSGRFMNRHFHRVDIIGEAGGAGYPLLMVANHFSWWDGFIQYRLNKALFGRRLHVMMSEQQLQRNMIMNRCGCFSVRKNSRSLVDTMRYAAGLLADSGNMVLVFPQGEIGSTHLDRIRFQSGTDYLMRHIGGPFRIVYNVNLTEFGQHRKPLLNIYHRTLDPGEFTRPGDIETGYNRFYRECLETQRNTVW